MRPRLEEWFLIHHGTALELPGYLVMLCLAIMAGCGVLLLYARHQNLHERAVYSFLILAIPSLIIGGKLLYAVQFPQSWGMGRDFWLSNGLASYGGLLGILVCGLAVFRYYRIPPGPYLDGCALALGLGLVFGRLGCFLSGCNWGRVTDLPWGVRFPQGSHAFRQQAALGWIPETTWLSLPVHPTQLYDAAFGLLLFLLGLWLLPRRRFQGEVFVTLLGLYCVLRFFEEYLRADYGNVLLGGLTFAQVVSVLLLMATISLSFAWRRYEIPASA